MTFEDAITGMIEHLRIKRERIEEAIAQLTALPAKSKRGRKSMSAEERKIVSQRMRNYWARRKAREQFVGNYVFSYAELIRRVRGRKCEIHCEGAQRFLKLHGARSNA